MAANKIRQNKLLKTLTKTVGICSLLAVGSIAPMNNEVEAEMVKLPSGLNYDETTAGSGVEAAKGKTVVVHYTGWLNENGEKGKKFDSSVDRGQEFSFPLGQGLVIKGWDEGVEGMKIGSKRTLFIPAELGYGSRGAGGVIPPNADLIFDVELIDVK